MEVLADSLHPDGQDCRHGYVKLNGRKVWNTTICSNVGDRRGTNILKIDPFGCTVSEPKHFDTFDSDAESNSLRDYINGLTDGDVIVGASAGKATVHLQPAYGALKEELGVHVYNVKAEGSFAFIAVKGHAKTLSDKAINRAMSDASPAQVTGAFTGTMHTLL